MGGVQFWIEGVALLVVSLFGVVGNLTTIVVLRRIDSNTTFNRLLMSLCEYSKILLQKRCDMSPRVVTSDDFIMLLWYMSWLMTIKS